MPASQEFSDHELLTRFEGLVDEAKASNTRELDMLRRDVTALKQRGSRPPGGHGPISGGAPLLAADQNLRTWLANPGGQKSVFTATVAFSPESKTQPISGVGGTIVPALPLTGPMQPALRLIEVLPQVGVEGGAAVQYARESSFTPSAAVVPEGGTKPATDMTFTQTLATILTFATVTRVSLQSLNDVPSLMAWLDTRLAYAVMLAAENQFLNAPAPDGLLASAGALSAAFTPSTTAPLDFIGSAISQLQSAGFSPDAVIMAGSDVNTMRLAKETTGGFIWASPDSQIGTSKVWGIPLIISPSIAPKTWLAGAFSQSCVLFMRQVMTLEISYEDRDNFILNLATIRAEERGALAIPNPGGLIKGTFA
jgi:HK97 family phage major capsid protein